MKSRRRIAAPDGSGLRHAVITAGNFGQWNGLQQTIAPQNPWAPDVRYGSLADIAAAVLHVRFSRHFAKCS